MKKNILIFKFPFQSCYGGGERHLISLVNELQQINFNFYLVTSCNVLVEQFNKRNWPVKKIWSAPEPVAKWSIILFPLLGLPMFLILVYFLFYYRLAKNVKGVYCISLTEKILITLPARMLGLKVFWSEHVGFQRWLTLNPLRIFYRFYSRYAKIIVVSQALKEQLIKLGVNASNIHIIYNGFDFSYYQSLLKKPKTQTKNQFVIGSIGRLEKEKGVDCLFMAVKKALTIVPKLNLIIVGEGSERKRLEWLSKNLQIDRLTQFVGFQKEPAAWIRNFDIFVLPSVGRESFGNVLVEALALERPAIASRIEGTPEIIKTDQTGILVQPGNSDELAQAIIYLYQNPDTAKQLGLNGRAFVEQNFPKERMVASYFQLFQNI
ncbi:glycosyltransferase family 4 protein [Patescibacteria group bacterium]|nr:glycosyltransferase family 4 protein [Patescibacteria group bacterium]MBU1890018.1 glycosyltransferase family 4 protein [Patescibacteria group bacterium]